MFHSGRTCLISRLRWAEPPKFGPVAIYGQLHSVVTRLHLDDSTGLTDHSTSRFCMSCRRDRLVARTHTALTPPQLCTPFCIPCAVLVCIATTTCPVWPPLRGTLSWPYKNPFLDWLRHSNLPRHSARLIIHTLTSHVLPLRKAHFPFWLH